VVPVRLTHPTGWASDMRKGRRGNTPAPIIEP
jgi:hypothetical protein